jgi:hypothetical protein
MHCPEHIILDNRISLQNFFLVDSYASGTSLQLPLILCTTGTFFFNVKIFFCCRLYLEDEDHVQGEAYINRYRDASLPMVSC